MEQVETEKYLEEVVEQEATYSTKDGVLYAVALGCTEPKFVFEGAKEFCLFPTFYAVLPIKGSDSDIVPFPSPAMLNGPQSPLLPGVEIGLEGERSVEIFKPLAPNGAKLTMKSRIMGIHHRGRGALVETETLVYDAKMTTVLARVVIGNVFVGAKSFKECGSSDSETVQYPPREADYVVELQVNDNQAMLYRLASGDYNPMHVSSQAAKRSGFPKPVLHPHCVFGMAARAVLQACGENDPSSLLSLKARFLGPVYPPSVLLFKLWKISNLEVAVQVFVKGNQPAVAMCMATIKPRSAHL